ncbi:MAG: hypothetical protein ACK4RZ_13610 [Paracoccaceae bacterium]
MTKPVITHVPGLSVPRSLGLRRDPPPRVKVTADAFWERYDSTTLFYIAVHDAAARQLHVFAPPLLNFAPLIQRAQFFMGGQKIQPPRVVHFEKFDRLIFENVPQEQALTMTLDGGDSTMPVHSCDPGRFAGKHVVYTLSKNNDLAWISDWMLWNQRKHKAEAVLFVDNTSTIYGLDDLAATLGAAPGYHTAEVMQVPFRYGPDMATAERAGDGKFLQTALMNALWMLSMRYARAMLNVDVDELIVSPTDEAIFDAVDTARYGIVMATGHWRYGAPGRALVRHRDHTLVLPDDVPCPPKYCLRPGGFAARQVLKVHGVKNFKRLPFVSRDAFTFIHCRNISNSWKYDRSRGDYGAMRDDPGTKALLDQVFSDTAAS